MSGADWRPSPRAEVVLAVLVICLAFGLRAMAPMQPIVENYVGRQVPTAMVARNLERGSGFLRPQLDTGPFPNLFVVEPPLYQACVVGLRKLTGLPLDPCGRLVSALGIAMGVWGLMGLCWRREGPRTALLAGLAFAVMPVTIRYGRAFQPDALMLGALLAGLDACDRASKGGRRWWLAGWIGLASAFAMKVTVAAVALPVLVLMGGGGRKARLLIGVVALALAALWYVHAARLLGEGEGSRASLDNAAIWGRALMPWLAWNGGLFALFARYLFVRTFTPLAVPLAIAGGIRGVAAMWIAWLIAAVGLLLALASKSHHEYYWLVLAPPLAVLMARAVAGRWKGALFGAAVAMGVALSASTWRTPAEWRGLGQGAAAIREAVPADAWVIAPEALLYAADRRGFRLEFDPGAAVRAAGEWGWDGDPPGDAEGLVRAYLELAREAGRPVAFADLAPEPPEPARLALHRAIRSGKLPLTVVQDLPGVALIATGSGAGQAGGSPR